MSKTLSDVRSQVRQYLDEAIAADWTDEDVDREINFAYHDVVTAVMTVYEEYYVVTTTLSLVANQQEYGVSDGVPTDMFKIRRIEVNYEVDNATSIPRRALPVNIDSVRRDLGNSALGIAVYRNPAYYWIGSESDSKIGLIPTPTKNSTNGFKLWYVKQQTDLTSSSSTFNIPYSDTYAKLIGQRAAAYLLRKGQQEEVVAKNYLAEYEQGIQIMKTELAERVADDSKMIVDTQFIDQDFTSYTTI